MKLFEQYTNDQGRLKRNHEMALQGLSRMQTMFKNLLAGKTSKPIEKKPTLRLKDLIQKKDVDKDETPKDGKAVTHSIL